AHTPQSSAIAVTHSHSSLFLFFFYCSRPHRDLHSFPTRRSSDLLNVSVRTQEPAAFFYSRLIMPKKGPGIPGLAYIFEGDLAERSEEHTSELQSLRHLVCRLLLEKKKKKIKKQHRSHRHR